MPSICISVLHSDLVHFYLYFYLITANKAYLLFVFDLEHFTLTETERLIIENPQFTTINYKHTFSILSPPNNISGSLPHKNSKR